MSVDEAKSIVELAETVKELVRIIQCMPNYVKLDDVLQSRLGVVYHKAVVAKDRVVVFTLTPQEPTDAKA